MRLVLSLQDIGKLTLIQNPRLVDNTRNRLLDRRFRSMDHRGNFLHREPEYRQLGNLVFTRS